MFPADPLRIEEEIGSKPPEDQAGLLILIDDAKRRIRFREDIVVEREQLLTEAEEDLAHERFHLKRLESQLNESREAAVKAAQGLSVYGSLPGIPDSAVEPGDYLPGGKHYR